jgi:amidophosphoribosyltransferase
MCGIVGLYLKNEALQAQLGAMFSPMLIAMGDRGPDSAGFARYGDEAPAGTTKVTLRSIGESSWEKVSDELTRSFAGDVGIKINGSYATFTVAATETELRSLLAANDLRVRVMSIGKSIEIMKEVGPPEEIVARFGVEKLSGTHMIGHTRMATESAVTTDGSHPFSTGMDLCLVHNGSLSNHNRLRRMLEAHGIQFHTENDSEVAAGYLTWRLREGDTLEAALHEALRDLDGFFTFAVGTATGFAVLRDPIACKPAVMAETDDYVAMASEYRSLAMLPGIAQAMLWEPEPATVYTWGRTVA